jgi:tRNA threonylcarbamoyladenosine modification (KEOPS) complex Cgi121 subunit
MSSECAGSAFFRAPFLTQLAVAPIAVGAGKAIDATTEPVRVDNVAQSLNLWTLLYANGRRQVHKWHTVKS